MDVANERHTRITKKPQILMLSDKFSISKATTQKCSIIQVPTFQPSWSGPCSWLWTRWALTPDTTCPSCCPQSPTTIITKCSTRITGYPVLWTPCTELTRSLRKVSKRGGTRSCSRSCLWASSIQKKNIRRKKTKLNKIGKMFGVKSRAYTSPVRWYTQGEISQYFHTYLFRSPESQFKSIIRKQTKFKFMTYWRNICTLVRK